MIKQIVVALVLVICFLHSFSYAETNSFNSQYCGSSACGYVLPGLNLASFQPNPVYNKYPEIQKRWNVVPIYTYNPAVNNNGNTTLSNLEIYKMKAKGISSQPIISQQSYTPQPQNYSNSKDAPLSNLEIYKMLRK
jgi:hypothetical protein